VKEMESTEIKDESESEDAKPADSSTVALSSKEPLVQATLSSMFTKAEAKKGKSAKPPRYAFSGEKIHTRIINGNLLFFV
jgi:hypothetical protein